MQIINKREELSNFFRLIEAIQKIKLSPVSVPPLLQNNALRGKVESFNDIFRKHKSSATEIILQENSYVRLLYSDETSKNRHINQNSSRVKVRKNNTQFDRPPSEMS